MNKRFAGVILLFVAFSLSAFGAPDAFRFAVLGDSRGGDNGVNSAILSEITAALLTENVDLVLFTGDLVSDGTQSALQYWVQLFMEPLQTAGIPVYPCRGNHDVGSGPAVWNAVFSGPYALPDNGPPGETGLTYSFTYKNALFIAVEQNLIARLYEVDQPWLDEQLAENPLPHVFVFGHYPAFAVTHPDCMASFPTPRDAFWNSLGRAEARVYFAGHDHFYDHAVIQDLWGLRIHQYVAGTAGAPLYTWSGAYAEASLVDGIAHFQNYGYMIVEVNGLDVQLTFKQRVDSGGSISYEATNDVFRFTGPMKGEGVPTAGIVGLGLAALLIVVLFAMRKHPSRIE